MSRLIELFLRLPVPPDPQRSFPDCARLRAGLERAVEKEGPEDVEARFLELYAHLHMNEAPYSLDERRRMDAAGGYWNHAGGLSPILKAGSWITPETVSADFGAGNGLQGLIMQKLYPHARTVQIEISSRMVEIGKRLQEWIGIAEDRVSWVVDDVLNVTPIGMDFVYLYRPVRPEGAGLAFYERFAADLDRAPRQVVVFSIADCLQEFLSDRFERFYYDGHLACYRRRG